MPRTRVPPAEPMASFEPACRPAGRLWTIKIGCRVIVYRLAASLPHRQRPAGGGVLVPPAAPRYVTCCCRRGGCRGGSRRGCGGGRGGGSSSVAAGGSSCLWRRRACKGRRVDRLERRHLLLLLDHHDQRRADVHILRAAGQQKSRHEAVVHSLRKSGRQSRDHQALRRKQRSGAQALAESMHERRAATCITNMSPRACSHAHTCGHRVEAAHHHHHEGRLQDIWQGDLPGRPGDAPPRSWTTCLSRWWRAHPPPRLPHPPPPATLPRCRVPWSGRVRACPARCAGAGPAVPPPRRRLQPRRAPGRIPPPRQRAALPTCAATLRVVRPPLRRGPRGATRALQLPPQPLRRAQSCPARAARGTRARRAPPPHEAPSRTASQQENPTKPRSGGGTAAGGCAPDVCLYLLVSAASLAALIPMNASRSRLLSGQPTLLAWCTVCCAALSRRWTCRAGRCAATLTSVGVRSQLASLALPLIASRPPAPVFRGRSRALLAVLLCRGGGRGRAWPAGVQRRARRRLCPHFQ